MPAARGDRKPCTHPHCPGAMTFGREPVTASPGISTGGQEGWVCAENPAHFKRAAEVLVTAAVTVPR